MSNNIWGAISIEKFINESGIEIPKNGISMSVIGVANLAHTALDHDKSSGEYRSIAPDLVEKFVRSLGNIVAWQKCHKNNVHTGGWDYTLYVTLDEESGTLFKSDMGYPQAWPLRQDGTRREEVQGDKDLFKKAKWGRAVVL